ncbi:hypothetical protein MRB53_040274 [Persea americana]|nr:hypothetical protein MRB53_040274 [Persea americana]
MADARDLSQKPIDELEARLRRISYAIIGNTKDEISNTENSTTAAARMRQMERQLQALASRSQAAAEVLDLQARRPDVFHAEANASARAMKPSVLAEIMLSHAEPLQRLSTQLTSLQSQSVPDSSHLVKIINLQSRMTSIQEKQERQNEQVVELRSRSAEALKTWYQNGLMDMSEHWADWEERLRDVEILVRRNEAAAKRDQGVV